MFPDIITSNSSSNNNHASVNTKKILSFVFLFCKGCGLCGGPGCGSVDMRLVAPTVDGVVPEGATSGDYCCNSGIDARAVTCGTGDPVVYPPCFVPAGAFKLFI